MALKPTLFSWIRRRFFQGRKPLPALPPLSDIEQARRLIQAIDQGGVPLNPAKVNAIARNLGLEVSRRAPVEHTIARIRACLLRA